MQIKIIHLFDFWNYSLTTVFNAIQLNLISILENKELISQVSDNICLFIFEYFSIINALWGLFYPLMGLGLLFCFSESDGFQIFSFC